MKNKIQINKKRVQNFSCAFAQIAIKDFAYKKQEVFCPFQITENKKFGKYTENSGKIFCLLVSGGNFA